MLSSQMNQAMILWGKKEMAEVVKGEIAGLGGSDTRIVPGACG